MKNFIQISTWISALFIAMQGHAFELARTHGGAPLQWRERTVLLHVAEESLRAPVLEAIALWNTVECGDFKFEVAHEIANPKSLQQNIIRYTDEWSHDRNILALTTLVFNELTGMITHADIELNAAHFVFTEIDVRNHLTHELGHVLGLAHPNERQMQRSIMAPLSTNGQRAPRTLEQDDIDGLCMLYPHDRREPQHTSCAQAGVVWILLALVSRRVRRMHASLDSSAVPFVDDVSRERFRF